MRKLFLYGLTLMAMCNALVGQEQSPPSQYRKAMSVLTSGSDHQSDLDDAVKLLRRAADSGYAPAQTALGTAYEQGIVVGQDAQQAILWYRKAGEQGDWIAQLSLGRLYFGGGPVARDVDQAKRWLADAAGDPRDNGAAFYLGLLFDDGQGTATNYKLAGMWYLQSAERGNPFAMEKLGQLLLKGVVGDPGPNNREEAYVYFLAAAAFGNHQVDQQLRSIDSDLTKSSVDAARQKAVALRERVLGNSRTRCGGWDGQFSASPTPPPLDLQLECDR